jgi:S1-C subfamily serine protease
MFQTQRVPSSLPRILLVCATLIHVAPVHAGTMNITSTPPGAKVEINGVAVGATPYHQNLPGSYFRAPHSVFSGRLQHAMTLRLSKDGYSPQEIELADGPFHFSTLNGKHHSDYYLIKSDHFEIALQALPAGADKALSSPPGNNVTREIRSASMATPDSLSPTVANASVNGTSPDAAVERVIRETAPAVVLLKTTQSVGSGFFLTSDGLIATSKHVVEGETAAIVTTTGGTSLYARVIYMDPRLDLAFLRVQGSGYAYLRLAPPGTVQRGETVVALGNPSSGLPGTVTKGIVSAVGHLHDEAGEWVQTDAAVNPGNSGGPLLTLRGDVAGINTLKGRNKEGIAFALSAADVQGVLNQLNLGTTTENSSLGAIAASASAAVSAEGGAGFVNIRSEPSEGEIYIDGSFVGTTPSRLRLASGKHKVEIRLEGKASWQRELEVFPESDASLDARLVEISQK